MLKARRARHRVEFGEKRFCNRDCFGITRERVEKWVGESENRASGGEKGSFVWGSRMMVWMGVGWNLGVWDHGALFEK